MGLEELCFEGEGAPHQLFLRTVKGVVTCMMPVEAFVTSIKFLVGRECF